jgi:hypothetical protein
LTALLGQITDSTNEREREFVYMPQLPRRFVLFKLRRRSNSTERASSRAI